MDRVTRMAPLSGLAFAVLFGVGSGIWVFDQPARGAETAEAVEFFEGASTEILAGGTLSLFSLIFLVWFGAILRDRLLAAEGMTRTGLPYVALAGSVLLAAVGLAAETVNMAGALSAEDAQLTGESAQIYLDLSYAFGAHAAGVAIAMVAIAVGVTALRTDRPVPRLAGWATVALGLVTATPLILDRVAFFILYTLAVIFFAALSVHLHRTQERA